MLEKEVRRNILKILYEDSMKESPKDFSSEEFVEMIPGATAKQVGRILEDLNASGYFDYADFYDQGMGVVSGLTSRAVTYYEDSYLTDHNEAPTGKELEHTMKKDSFFSVIPSQFDDIVEDHPIVFISYSWDSEDHKTWVRKLSDDLRTKYSVNVLLDQYNRGGYDLITFMKKAVKISDRVLLIGTPRYKEKTDLYEGGGVKYEDQLISIELYHRIGTSKFIPVLREGKFDTSFSDLIETRMGYSMLDTDNYEDTLHQLAADIWNTPFNAVPALGPKPTFVNKVDVSNPAKTEITELSVEQFVAEVKRLLSTPNSEIAYTEMIESEAQCAYNAILTKANYNFSITTESFDHYASFHFSAVEKLIAASIVVIRYGTAKQQELFVDAIVKLCMKPVAAIEESEAGTPYLHLLAGSFLFHSMGLACLKYGYYQILPLMMERRVPPGNVLSSSHSYPLAHLVGVEHWSSDLLNIYMDSHWLYPYTQFIMNRLMPLFDGVFFNDKEYKTTFYTWEHLFSLMYVYYKCSLIKHMEFFPVGEFLHNKDQYIIGESDNIYTMFFSKAKTEKDNWPPVKQGLFDGKYANFEEVYERAEEYYRKNPRC